MAVITKCLFLGCSQLADLISVTFPSYRQASCRSGKLLIIPSVSKFCPHFLTVFLFCSPFFPSLGPLFFSVHLYCPVFHQPCSLLICFLKRIPPSFTSSSSSILSASLSLPLSLFSCVVVVVFPPPAEPPPGKAGSGPAAG